MTYLPLESKLNLKVASQASLKNTRKRNLGTAKRSKIILSNVQSGPNFDFPAHLSAFRSMVFFVIPPFFCYTSMFFVILGFSYTFQNEYNKPRYNKTFKNFTFTYTKFFCYNLFWLYLLRNFLNYLLYLRLVNSL